MSQDTSEANNSSLTAAQQFLDSIDADVNLSSTDGTTEASAQPSKPADAKEIMSFIDEWTTPSATTENDVDGAEKREQVDPQTKTSSVQQAAQSDSGAGWASWGNSLWSQASAAVKAGTDQINKVTQDSETAKLFEGRVKDIQSFVNTENIGKLGSELRNLTLTGVSTLLDTVAPPLSEEEIVEVWLNKGQLGYLGLEQITYRAWASVLEQTATGDIVVQTDDKESSNNTLNSSSASTIGLHKGLAEAKAVAKAEIQALAEKHPSTQPIDAAAASTTQGEEAQNEIRICPVYLSVQATNLDLVEDHTNQMAFILLLSDPRHKLEFQGLSQSIPKRWLEIPYEENEWVEENTGSSNSTFFSSQSEIDALSSTAHGTYFDSMPECTANTATRDNITLSKKLWTSCLDAGSEPSAYLSIVIVTRMDDYAGNQFHRFQNFINSAYLLAEHTREHIELLIVEWNPPANTRRVYDVLRFRRSKYLSYRILAVPTALHNVIPNVGNAPLHEFEGKNLGIRFARGEYVLCTNQDDIWSVNFHNAIKSHYFREGVIYLQHQDRHNIHDELPPSIVRLPSYPDDDTLYNACVPTPQDWGNFKSRGPIGVDLDNILQVADQAGDFTLAHRDTWKLARGYRETGGVAWVDIEFVCTAAWTLGLEVEYISETLACHQDHPNVWENTPERHTDNTNIDMGEIMRKEKIYINEADEWGMQKIDIWQYGLDCHQFGGGLCW